MIWSRVTLALVTLLFVTSAAHPADNRDKLSLRIGQLNNTRERSQTYVYQPVSVTNNDQVTVERIEIECGFFDGGKLIGTRSTTLRNLAPNTTGFGTVILWGKLPAADSAQCRIARAD
jgi:hypothetical protein